MRQACLGRGGAVVLAALLLSGCGQRLVQVEGVIQVDGKPLEKGAMVTFSPLGDTRPATAVTDETGTFRLQTFKPGDGVMPGEYKVVIHSTDNFVPLPVVANPENAFDPAWERYLKAVEALQNRPPRPGALPKEYGNPATTPLTWKVPEDGPKVVLNLEGYRRPARGK